MWTLANTHLYTWFERGNAHVELETLEPEGATIIKYLDEEVHQAQIDGFLSTNSKKWHQDLVDYANQLGLVAQVEKL